MKNEMLELDSGIIKQKVSRDHDASSNNVVQSRLRCALEIILIRPVQTESDSDQTQLRSTVSVDRKCNFERKMVRCALEIMV